MRPHRRNVCLSLLSALLIGVLTLGCGGEDPTVVNQVDFPDAGELDDVGENGQDTDVPGPDAGEEEEDADRPPPGGGDEFEWDDELSLIAVSPARGPLSGGTQVFFNGTGLTEETTILFGDVPVSVTISQGQLRGTTPPSDTMGPVTVRAINPDGETVTLVNGFTYSNGLGVSSVTPRRVPTTGGVEITLLGQGFMEPMGVSFGGTGARRIDVVSDTVARVVVPERPRGQADLRVSIPDETVVLEDHITFYRPLFIEAVAPGFGSTDGGDLVTIQARGLTLDTLVYLDDVPAPVQAIDVAAGEITALTPPSISEGLVDVLLENDDDAYRLRDGFAYDDGSDDGLFHVAPRRAPVSGGSEHRVTGRGLDAPNAELIVGGQAATILSADASGATFLAPAVSAGDADVELYHGASLIDVLPDALTYFVRPTLSGVSPDAGPAAGGQSVTLTGAGFSSVTGVEFGSLPAAFTVVNDTEIQVTTPRAEAGPVSITLRAGPERVVAANAYRFEGELQLWSMRPSRGALAGGTYVRLQGSHFEGLIEVMVGDAEASDVLRIDPYTVVFRTPRMTSSGPRDVSLSALGQEADAPYPFVYFNPAGSVAGASGAFVDGAMNATVVTQNGAPIPGAFVMLSARPDTPFQGFTNSNGQVTLSGPGLLGPQTITATAPEFSSFTIRHLNAENVTIVLTPLEAEGGGGAGQPPPIGRVSGVVTISGKSEDPAGGEDLNMSIVRTTMTHPTGPILNPGTNATVAGEGPYSINTRVGDMALVVLCGVYDQATEVFEPRFMGVERYLFLSDQDHQQVDLDCNIRLDKDLAIKLVDPVYAPTGPTINEVRTYLDFGFEGVFRFPGATRGLSDLLVTERLPALSGVLADVSFTVVAGSYTGTGVPYTQTTLENITNLSSIHSTPPLLAVPELINPSPGGLAQGELRLGKKGINDPDLYFVVLRSGMGLPVWSFVVPGYERVIPLPEFPSFDGLPADAVPEPYQPGTLFAVSYAMRIPGFRFHSFTSADFGSARWSAFSVSTWQVRIAD